MLDKKTVGTNIANYRKRKEITQKELAGMLNISAQSISKWESGVSMPTVEMLHDAAEILEVSVDSLLSDVVRDNRDICYLDTGLDTNRLYLLKDELENYVTRDQNLIYSHYIDPSIFKINLEEYDDPVFALTTNVPGSKARLAREHGYDSEISADVAARAMNNVLRMGLMPKILQAHIVCGNKEGSHIKEMAKSFKKVCEENDVIFSGLEVACQPVNFHANEYEISVGLVAAGDRNELLTNNRVQEGDIIIGIMTEGIESSSYPFIRVMLDRKPELLYSNIDKDHKFIDEILKPNLAFVKPVRELQKAGLIHGMSRCENSILHNLPYAHSIPNGLGACINLSAIPIKPLYRYMQKLEMVGRNYFPYRFSMGFGMMLITDKSKAKEAVDIISRYNECHIIGRIEKNTDHKDFKVWSEGRIKW